VHEIDPGLVELDAKVLLLAEEVRDQIVVHAHGTRLSPGHLSVLRQDQELRVLDHHAVEEGSAEPVAREPRGVRRDRPVHLGDDAGRERRVARAEEEEERRNGEHDDSEPAHDHGQHGPDDRVGVKRASLARAPRGRFGRGTAHVSRRVPG
jgi:hypothetical protein